MRTSIFAGLLAVSTTANAFTDSHPFMLFSTSPLPVDHATASLESSSKVLTVTKNILDLCPTKNYLVVSQPDLQYPDLYRKSGSHAHRLHRAFGNNEVKDRFQVMQVVELPGSSDVLSIADLNSYISKACAAKGVDSVAVRTEEMPPLPAMSNDVRDEAMGDNDYLLGSIFEEELKDGDYTVIYFGSKAARKAKPAPLNDAQSPLKKRSAGNNIVRRADNKPSSGYVVADNAPLFEKYAFFSPGIFMGLVGLSVIFSILYVGLKSVASLQVSYGAFDKELGPASQKKTQ